jgi:hypothetical protein
VVPSRNNGSVSLVLGDEVDPSHSFWSCSGIMAEGHGTSDPAKPNTTGANVPSGGAEAAYWLIVDRATGHMLSRNVWALLRLKHGVESILMMKRRSSKTTAEAGLEAPVQPTAGRETETGYSERQFERLVSTRQT